MSETLRVGIQAQAARSYHEDAAGILLNPNDDSDLASALLGDATGVELVMIPKFPALYDAAEGKNGQAARFPDGLDYIVAAEQSTAMRRWVHRSTDQLFRPDRSLYVHRRAWLRVPLGIVVSRQTIDISALQNPPAGKKVYIHVQEEALEQCETQLDKLLPNAKIMLEDDGAGAVTEIVTNTELDPYHIAIAGPAAAEANGGIYTGMQLNAADAATSFLLMSRTPKINPLAHKSLIVVTEKEDFPGSLASIQDSFSGPNKQELKVNLTLINSRPTETIGRYDFILEASVSIENTSMREALQMIGDAGHDIKIIGSFDEIGLDRAA